MPNTISIVIPVKNEAKNIRLCIESWINQSVPVEKIVVIDSGSTDGTIEILNRYRQVELIEIEQDNFNHGTTRNTAIQRVTTDLVLLTVGDGRAADNQVLERMCNVMRSEDVAGVCGHQIVAHERDKNPVRWFRPQSTPVVCFHQFDSAQEFDCSSPEKKKLAGSWDNVIALYRTKILREIIPFKTITYGEDSQWAVDALRAGHKLAYHPAARVYHYHQEDSHIAYKRTITSLYLRDHFFGHFPLKKPGAFKPTIVTAKILAKTPNLTVAEKCRWFLYNLQQIKAERQAVRDYVAARHKGQDSIHELHNRCVGRPFKVAA